MTRYLLTLIVCAAMAAPAAAQNVRECKDDTEAGIVGTIKSVEKSEKLATGQPEWQIWLQTIEPGQCYVEVVTIVEPPPESCKASAKITAFGVTSHLIVPELEASEVTCLAEGLRSP